MILIEPQWNPQLEAQATDRIYRVGQKKRYIQGKIGFLLKTFYQFSVMGSHASLSAMRFTVLNLV